MKHIAIALINFYRKYLSPLKRRPCCRFTPTCSAYALEAFQKRGFFVGMALTVYRILRCQPFCAGGYDPVPEKGFRPQTGQAGRTDADDGGTKKGETFSFEYDLPLESREEKSKKTKNKRED